MSGYTKQEEDDFGVHCYSDEEKMRKILEVANEKIEGLYYMLVGKKNIEVYRFNITNGKAPQIALKIYKIGNDCDETKKILNGVLDVSVDELNSILEFYFYKVSKGAMYTYAQFINGEWGSNDGIAVPMQQNQFDTKNIDRLIEDIINMHQ
ncbi:MAG TPA: hypothetical protein VIK72_04775 [Clostridiaceae bacterium]